MLIVFTDKVEGIARETSRRFTGVDLVNMRWFSGSRNIYDHAFLIFHRTDSIAMDVQRSFDRAMTPHSKSQIMRLLRGLRVMPQDIVKKHADILEKRIRDCIS